MKIITARDARNAKNLSDARRFPQKAEAPAIALHPAAGKLIRKGKAIYYAFINGVYVETTDAAAINAQLGA